VAKFTNQQQDNKWSFCANVEALAETSVCLKVKNKLECCKILAPTCPAPPEKPVSSENIPVNQLELAYEIVSDSAGNCIDLAVGSGFTVDTYDLDKIRIKFKGGPGDPARWFPICEPFATQSSPGKSCVRLSTGKVKCVKN
jgi:hypothetical protein